MGYEDERKANVNDVQFRQPGFTCPSTLSNGAETEAEATARVAEALAEQQRYGQRPEHRRMQNKHMVAEALAEQQRYGQMQMQGQRQMQNEHIQSAH